MTPTQLRAFHLVAESGSFSAAARASGLSQPNLSTQVTALEEAYGVRLFDRSTRRLSATNEGQRLVTHARRLLAAYESAVCGNLAAPPQGLLRITAPMVFGRRYMTPVVTKFLMRHAEIQVDLFLSDRNVDLIDNGIDLALRIGALEDSGLVARQLGAVRRVTVASPAYLERYGEPSTPEELAQHELILGTMVRGLAEWRYRTAAREHIVRFTPRLQVNDVEGVLSAAREGFGIARALSYQAAADLHANTLARLLIDYEPEPIPVHLVFPSARHMAPRVRAFVDFAMEEFAQTDVR